MTALNIFLVLAGVVLVIGILLFNRLVSLKQQVREAWSGIDVQLKRRFDLVGKLMEVVSAAAQYERSTLEAVTSIRSRIGSAGFAQRALLESELSEALKGVFAVVEAYPDLKANSNFMDLQKNISAVEDTLQYARRYYNGAVRNYNVAIQTFPGNFVAGVLGFTLEEFFGFEEPR